MNPTTGTFISMDTYQGSIFDPVSLHKYLYANANPVTYCDPSGYFGLTDVVCANAIGNTLFYGTSAGLINVGLNLLRELRAAERYGTTIDFGYVITMSFTEGFLTGAFFGTCGMLAQSLNSALIYMALGGSSFLFASMSLAQAEADRSNGDYDLMAFDLLFAAGGFLGAKHCFDNAYSISTASNTAKSSTNTSTENTNTAKNSAYSNQSGSINKDTITNSATSPKKGGETVVGHALQKHAGRHPEIWGKVKGGPDQINEAALNHLNEIINAPGDFVQVTNDRGITFWEKMLPDGRGVRLNMDGTFKGFIDQ